MRLRVAWSRGAVGAALLVVLTGLIAAAVANLVPLLDPGNAGCVHPVPLLAPLGIHFDVLAPADVCPEGTYLPGANFVAALQMHLTVLCVAFVGTAAALLAAFGVAAWVVATWTQIRAALRNRLRLPEAVTVLVVASRPSAPRLFVIPHGFDGFDPVQRRGPPAPVLLAVPTV